MLKPAGFPRPFLIPSIPMAGSLPARAKVVADMKELSARLQSGLLHATVHEDYQSQTVGMLGTAIHDGAVAAITLIGTPGESQLAVLTRANFEAYADLVNSLDDHTYALTLHRESARSARVFWAEVADLASAVEGAEDLGRDATEHVRRIDERIAALDRQGARAKPQTVDKFQPPRVSPAALSVFRHLCSPAHNDAGPLLERFATADRRFVLGRPLPDWQMLDLLFLSGVAVMATLNAIPRFANCDGARHASEVVAARAALDRIIRAKQIASAEHKKGSDNVDPGA